LAKNLKINIKNTQIAQAINLESLKGKLAKKKEATPAEEPVQTETKEAPKGAPKARAARLTPPPSVLAEELPLKATAPLPLAVEVPPPPLAIVKTEASFAEPETNMEAEEPPPPPRKARTEPLPRPPKKPLKPPVLLPNLSMTSRVSQAHLDQHKEVLAQKERLGPTGRHVKDLLPPPPPPPRPRTEESRTARPVTAGGAAAPRRPETAAPKTTEGPADDKKGKPARFKEFRDIKPARKTDNSRGFDGRDRQGLRDEDEGNRWRKRRSSDKNRIEEDATIRPTEIKVRTPISIKDLAVEMKLKSSQLVQKLFLQGIMFTLNDLLDDETTLQLLGQEFGCLITIDTAEEERIRITDKSIRDEINQSNADERKTRPPVVAFMGHVDHGKTSLIDAIRKSNRVAGEAGAITQHIGAFRCHTAVGDITVLDTPGHEAFSSMRARGADVTDIVVLVVAGDEGIRQQTLEAIQHALAAQVTIVVAINKSDKPNFNAENVYRQLADNNLLPEAWGGQTITINCSAMTGEGIPQLLEMLALQAEVLELRANPTSRARGSVIESEMHKGLGSVATVLVQNGTLHPGDAVVFSQHWGRVKTMRNELGEELELAPPSTPVEITGLSGLPNAGEEFIVVKNEREAREIAEKRLEGVRQSHLALKKKLSMEGLLQANVSSKKILTIVLRADVQGSLEALKVALQKIESTKAEINIIFTGVGEISESDVQLAAASKAVIIGFHTQIESHADALVKEMGIQVRLHDIIYHAIDDVKLLMAGLLDRIAVETEKGKAEVRAVFKSSQLGLIAGCQVIEGTITRGNTIRVRRGQEVVWKGALASLRRVKEDVREVTKGTECGILLVNYSEVQEGDILEAFEVTYLTQEL